MSITQETLSAEHFYCQLINDKISYELASYAPTFPAHSVLFLNKILPLRLKKGRSHFGKPILAIYCRDENGKLHHENGPALIEWIVNSNSFDAKSENNKIEIMARYECFRHGIPNDIKFTYDAVNVQNMIVEHTPDSEYPYNYQHGFSFYREHRKDGLLHNNQGTSVLFQSLGTFSCPSFWNTADIACDKTCITQHCFDQCVKAYHTDGHFDGLVTDYPSLECSFLITSEMFSRMGLNPKLAENETRVFIRRIGIDEIDPIHIVKMVLHEDYNNRISMSIPKIQTPRDVSPEEAINIIKAHIANALEKDYSSPYENFMDELRLRLIKVMGSSIIFPPEKDFSNLEI